MITQSLAAARIELAHVSSRYEIMKYNPRLHADYSRVARRMSELAHIVDGMARAERDAERAERASRGLTY